ncbi:MAG TPA: tetratricopeptide repeat protein [Spirochaetota bacterium]|nr:tetratricopeptide repeat protein [Spirochaetota bacterium]
MKRSLLTLLIIISSLSVQSKDFNKTEEMIDTILSEESGSAVKQEKEQTEQQAGDEAAVTVEDETGAKDDAASSGKNTMSGKDESIYKTAIQLYNTGYYDHSLAKFNEIISNHGDSKFLDNAHVWAGRIYIKKYKYDDAIKEFDSVRDISGEYPASLFYKAEAYRFKGDNISSIEFYQKYASEYPGNPLAPYSILNAGKLYLSNKQGTQSLEAAIKLIKNYPDSDTIDDAYYLIAKIYEKDPVLKDVESARKYYKIFLKKAANNEKYFSDSPLLPAVKRDMEHLEKTHFKMER